VIAPVRLVDERGGMDFLGAEWLTWLWWRAAEEPRFVHPDGSEVYLHVDDHMEWRGERSAARRTTLRAGVPGASVEARAALRSGKTLAVARLLMARGEREVRFTLRAEDLDVSSVRLPAPEGADPEERLAESLASLDAFFSDLDLCLAEFLKVRCGDGWAADLGKIRAFVARPSEDERTA
jgi:hypothetical protein